MLIALVNCTILSLYKRLKMQTFKRMCKGRKENIFIKKQTSKTELGTKRLGLYHVDEALHLCYRVQSRLVLIKYLDKSPLVHK